MQVKSQAPPVGQMAVAFAGGLHVVQVPPQRRKPGSHATPHVVAFTHTCDAFGSEGHSEHDDGPQLLTLELGTQVCPHRCWPDGHEQVEPLQLAPAGHSELIRQPTVQVRETGSQLNPGAHPPATTQSVGNGRQVPLVQTWPEPQSLPHPPQLFSSLS